MPVWSKSRHEKNKHETDKEYIARLTSYIQSNTATDDEYISFLFEGMKLYTTNRITQQRLAQGGEFVHMRVGDARFLQLLDGLMRRIDNLPPSGIEFYLQQLVNLQEVRKNKLTTNSLTFAEQLKIRESHKSIDDFGRAIDYSRGTEIHDDTGKNAMSGLNYVRRVRHTGGDQKNYKHLRSMLQQAWKLNGTHPSEQFEIDYRFSYKPRELAMYLEDTFSGSLLDDAHFAAINTYAGRGRPQGSRNRDKVFGQRNSDSSSVNQFSSLMNNLPDEQDISDDVSKANGADANKIVPENLSEYVTHVQLEAKHYAPKDMVVTYVDRQMMTIKREIAEALMQIAKTRASIVELKTVAMGNVDLGLQHFQFPDLLKLCNTFLEDGTRLNILLVGPAATGKSVAAKYVAKAMSILWGRDCPFYTLPALNADFQVLGYNGANGQYVTTNFRKCWEFGGVIALEELDAYSQSAALALNGALANGICAFPDGMVPRHKDCIIIGNANTYGLGGTHEYTGRVKQDAAFMSRWNPMDWPIDEVLEDALCSDKRWLAIVREVRANVIRQRLQGIIITPRATYFGLAQLKAGLSVEKVIKSLLKGGMTDAQWEQVKPRVASYA